MARLLTDEERYQVTGYKRGADQARWFREHGYYVECNARGIPIISHEQLDERRRPTPPEPQDQQQQTRQRTEPNVVSFRNKLKLQS
jgi:hypothetical protein